MKVEYKYFKTRQFLQKALDSVYLRNPLTQIVFIQSLIFYFLEMLYVRGVIDVSRHPGTAVRRGRRVYCTSTTHSSPSSINLLSKITRLRQNSMCTKFDVLPKMPNSQGRPPGIEMKNLRTLLDPFLWTSLMKREGELRFKSSLISAFPGRKYRVIAIGFVTAPRSGTTTLLPVPRTH